LRKENFDRQTKAKEHSEEISRLHQMVMEQHQFRQNSQSEYQFQEFRAYSAMLQNQVTSVGSVLNQMIGEVKANAS
jgi:hypothetical protein